MTQEKVISSYLKQVKKNCPLPIRKKLLSDLRSHLYDFFDANPGSSLDDIIVHMGAPEKYADEYLMAMEENARKRALNKAKWIKITVLLGVSIIVFTVAATACYIIYQNGRTTGGYYYEVIIEDYIIPD